MISRFFAFAGRCVSVPAFAFAAVLAVCAVSAPASAQTTTSASVESSDVRALFASWRQDERQRRGVMAIPSLQPVEGYRLTSSYGTRSDPFRRGRRMHNGLDMAGPIGTPIYATADGIVGRAQWVGGYGKYVEINHGGEIQTRYGHMSAILVQPGARVTRGQLIGRMGSTGRSTGSHLHYEVRISGRPVNPVPFLTSGDYLASLPATSSPADGPVAVGAGQ
ncbi:peptidase M23-like protein [Parasphingopyxis lamellibrachiae]|uniref:Peptidase M23-like protein n=2 Tax=Parasphingopyxis lamellibrachiae TaxID=680125 RepID=A0A3D9FFS3_9SPHN|nr:peptidase M23-like protein [Parasphingopyxis lamellibrachiae]